MTSESNDLISSNVAVAYYLIHIFSMNTNLCNPWLRTLEHDFSDMLEALKKLNF